MIGQFTLRVCCAALAVLALCGNPVPLWGFDAPSSGQVPPRIEVVFALDTTGSMTELLQAAKEQIWSIATDLACAQPAPELKLGLVAYRDRNDAYVTRRTDLTTDLDAVYTELMGLRADGGGDAPESVNQGLYEAVTEMQWSPDPHAYRAVFVVGDAPPHMEYPDDVTYPRSCQLARERGIVVNAIQCGQNEATATVWSDIAQQGEGAFVRLEQSGGTPMIATPYDKGIAAMAKQLDETRLAYGTDAERAAVEQRRERAEHIYDHSTLGEQASRGVFNVTATGRSNQYGSKDLVGDCQRGVVNLDDIDSAQLPEPLRSMNATERRAYFQHQVKLREDLELTLQSLAAQRRDYLAGELAKRGTDQGSLRARLLAAMQSQAKRHGLELGSCPTASR